MKRVVAFLKKHKRAEEEVGGIVAWEIGKLALRRLGLIGAGVAMAATVATFSSSSVAHHPTFSLSKQGAAFVTRNEGVRYRPYNDPYNCTVGVGHLIHMGACSASDYRRWTISPAQATSLLLHDAGSAEWAVRTGVTRSINQAQFDALVDFAFNVGGGGLLRSNVLRDVNSGNWRALPGAFAVWSYASGHYLSGLHARRVAESRLFLTNYYGPGIGRLVVVAKPKIPMQAPLPRAYVFPGRHVQIAVKIRPAALAFLHRNRKLRAFAGLASAGHVSHSDHYCGYALDLVPLAGATAAGHAATIAGYRDAVRHHFAYVESLRLTWHHGNHHLHISFRRCPKR